MFFSHPKERTDSLCLLAWPTELQGKGKARQAEEERGPLFGGAAEIGPHLNEPMSN